MRLSTIIGIYILAFLMAVQAFMMPLVYVGFKLQQDYIAQNLCENRNVPMTVCYGTCVLRKALKKTTPAEQTPSGPSLKIKIDVGACPVSVVHVLAFPRLLAALRLPPRYQPQVLPPYLPDFFIPPRG